MDTSCGFLRYTADAYLMRRDNLNHVSCSLTFQELRVFFMNERCQVPSIIQDHVQRLISWERRDGLIYTPLVLFLSFPFPSEDGNASSSDSILGY